MKFINIDIAGKVNNKTPYFLMNTCLMGHIKVSYKKLVEVFGKPNNQKDNYKSDAEWLIFTPDGVACIYNYKDGKNYLRKEGLEVEDITNWHIGGKNKQVVHRIRQALNI